MLYRKLIVEKIEKIYQIIDEIQFYEAEQIVNIQRNQSTIISKLDKLQEYNEIDDMNNAVVCKKLQQIYEKI